MDRSKILLSIAGVLILALAVLYGCRFLFGDRKSSADELADIAIKASTPQEQEEATAKLVALGKSAQPQLARVLAESKTPGVRAAVITELASQFAYDSMPAILDALDDPSYEVRVSADRAMKRMVQIPVDYRAEDLPEKRRAAVEVYRKTWEHARNSPRMKVFIEEMKAKAAQPEA